jgi:hypothetical protein
MGRDLKRIKQQQKLKASTIEQLEQNKTELFFLKNISKQKQNNFNHVYKLL